MYNDVRALRARKHVFVAKVRILSAKRNEKLKHAEQENEGSYANIAGAKTENVHRERTVVHVAAGEMRMHNAITPSSSFREEKSSRFRVWWRQCTFRGVLLSFFFKLRKLREITSP